MMVFNDTNKVPVYDQSTRKAEYVSAKARTVIIDSGLLEKNQEHRYRFTMGHEAAHDIIHSGHYTIDPNQMSMLDMGSAPMVQCRIDTSKLLRKRKALWTDVDWMEWQANRLSSAILMPVSMVRRLIDEEYPTASVFHAASCVYAIYRTFNVSVQAAEIRLRDLGIITGMPKQAIMDELSLFAT
jgi:Zn-dependent peptidase ImmA (M78 family)